MKKFQAFKRTVNYYETDMMQVVHHSNYIRWFEEARTYMLDCIGYPYARIEDEGFMIPVLSVGCEYKIPCRFGEEIYIIPKLTGYNGVRMKIKYEVWDTSFCELRTIGESSHCFVNSRFEPMSPRKSHENLDKVLRSALNLDLFFLGHETEPFS